VSELEFNVPFCTNTAISETISSRVRVRIRVRVKIRVSVLVRVSIRTSWVVNFTLFRCYRPVIYTRP